jgi:gamma-glutamyltranspeptidase / glutathione hydrolase
MTLQKLIASFVLGVLMMPTAGLSADLSPGKWNPDEKARAEQGEKTPWPSKAQVVEGKSGLVAGTMSPIAVLAGVETLRQGGTAADAAATVALTQITTAFGSYVSYAGILQLVYYDEHSGKVYALNAPWHSWRGETDPKSIPVADLEGLPFARTATAGAEGRKTLVPGFMAGIEAMHQSFGRLPLNTLFQPAIWYAENGVTVSPLLAKYFSMNGKFLARTPEGRAFLRQAGNALPQAGDKFVQADLAKTLRGVAQHGSKYMYTGAWGKQFVATVAREGGKASLADMKSYRVEWQEPQSTTFAGHTVYAPGVNNPSGCAILESLNLAEAMHLDQMRPYSEDPQVFRALSGIVRFSDIDGVPRLTAWKQSKGLSVVAADRVTKPYAQALLPLLTDAPGQQKPADPHHSDSVVVVDRWGNVAALVHSINTGPWGDTGIVVGGVPISNAAGFQQDRLAAIQPGNAIPQDEAPVIALSGTVPGGKPTLAIATIGVSLLPETVRLLVSVLGNHLDPLTAMAAPPMLLNFEPSKAGEKAGARPDLIPADAYSQDFLKSLSDSGFRVETKSKYEVFAMKGTAVMGVIDPENGTLRSVEKPEIFGFATAF